MDAGVDIINAIISEFQSRYMQMVNSIYTNIPLIVSIFFSVAVLYIVYFFLTRAVRGLLKKAIRKEEDINLFLSIWKYGYFLISILILFFVYSGSLAGLGFSIGLIAAALSFALQRPIASITAWILLTLTKPFRIGDRILVKDIIGDVIDMNIMHLVLRECGGTTSGEENSERIVLIPNYNLFETPVINYTKTSPYILDELKVSITYESSWEKAERILIRCAESVTEDIIKISGRERPYVRARFADSGIIMILRYVTLAKERERIKNKIARMIWEEVRKEKDVEFAYPHIQLVK